LLTRSWVKRPNVPDKGASIGKVAVMRACRDRRFRDGIALVLERAHGVDDQTWVQRCKGLSEITAYVHRRRFGRIDRIKGSNKGLGLGQGSPGYDQGYRWIVLQRTRDIAAEVAVATKDQDSHCHRINHRTICQDIGRQEAKKTVRSPSMGNCARQEASSRNRINNWYNWNFVQE
jgi:hypothetical protein